MGGNGRLINTVRDVDFWSARLSSYSDKAHLSLGEELHLTAAIANDGQHSQDRDIQNYAVLLIIITLLLMFILYSGRQCYRKQVSQ